MYKAVDRICGCFGLQLEVFRLKSQQVYLLDRCRQHCRSSERKPTICAVFISQVGRHKWGSIPSAYCDVIGLLLERHCKHLLGSFAAPEQAALCRFCPTIYSMVFLMCSCRSSGSREPTSLPTFTRFLWRCCSACGQIVFHLVIIGFQSFCSSHCRWLASRLILWQDSAKRREPNVVVLHSLKFEASNALRCQGH